MMLWLLVFGKPELLARILKLESSTERIPPGTIVVAAAFKKVAVTKIPIKKVAA